MESGYGLVYYSDEPYNYSFLQRDNGADILYLKKKSWAHEEEFRFITVGIGKYSTRLQTFSPDIVSEIILGYAISAVHEGEIVGIVNARYGGGFPVYKTKKTEAGSLIKERIS